MRYGTSRQTTRAPYRDQNVSPWRRRIERGCSIALLTLIYAFASTAAAEEQQDLLRVCADPNNMPFSNRAGEGFENKLAELVARELGKTVSYTWHPQRRGFIRKTLDAGECDVIMGVPNMDMLDTTRPYYRSSYVFVRRAEDNLDFSSINAPELRELTIGVHLIGDDGANSPPAHALGQQQIVDNVVGYTVYGDYSEEAPPSRLINAVARDEIDVAAAWGPLAGYFVQQSSVPLEVVPITDTLEYLPLIFQYSISMGVRDGDETLKGQLNAVIHDNQAEIRALLDAYNVPRVSS